MRLDFHCHRSIDVTYKCNLLSVMLDPVIISGLTVKTGREMVLTSKKDNIRDMN